MFQYLLQQLTNTSPQSSEAHGRPQPYVDIFCPSARVVCYLSMSTSHKTTTAASFVLAICGRFQRRSVVVQKKTVRFLSLNSKLTWNTWKFPLPNVPIQPPRQLFCVPTPRSVLPLPFAFHRCTTFLGRN